MKKILKFILIAALCLAGVATISIVAFVTYFGYQLDQAIKPVTDIERYPEFIGAPGEPFTAHFPRTIPDNAKNVKLYFAPGFAQGGTILQLRMQLPPDEIAALVDQFQTQAKRRYVPDGENNSPKAETSPDGVNVAFDYRFHTGDHGPDEIPSDFPDDYAIYVLEDTRGVPEYDWNHPEHYGIAINEETSDVVYWMEDW